MNKSIVIILVALLLILAACGTAATSGSTSTTATQAPTSVPTATPTPKPATWTTVQQFSGSGNKKTAIFTAPDDWKILWTCNGGAYGNFLSVTIYDNNNTFVDLAISEQCNAGKTAKGETEEHQGGSIYLDISGNDQWSLQVQVLK